MQPFPPTRREILESIKLSVIDSSNALGPVFKSASLASRMPCGGEKGGWLTVASVNATEVERLDSAILALWKLACCFGEEWPYVQWTDQELINVATHFYEPDWNRWVHQPAGEASDLIVGLTSLAEGNLNIECMHDETNFSCFPDREAARLLRDIPQVVTVLGLQVGLSQRWNRIESVFKFSNRFWWVEWGTNA